MRKRLRLRHDAQVRANGVCTRHSDILDVTPGGHQTRTALAAQVAEVDRLFAAQAESIEERRAAVAEICTGRQWLRNAVKVIVKVGKLVTVDETTMTTMRLLGSVSDDELVAYTQGLLNHIAPYVDAFVAHGMPPDLVRNIETALQRFAVSKNAYQAARQRFTAATEMIREAQAKADDTIEVIEAVAVITPASDGEMLTMLRMAKRIGPRSVAPPAQPALALVEPDTTSDHERSTTTADQLAAASESSGLANGLTAVANILTRPFSMRSGVRRLVAVPRVATATGVPTGITYS